MKYWNDFVFVQQIMAQIPEERSVGDAFMTKKEIGKLIESKKFSKNVRCFGDDKLRGFIKEIYFDGMREGYELAKFRLELLNGLPSGAADRYLDEHMEDIRNIINLCEQYESYDEHTIMELDNIG